MRGGASWELKRSLKLMLGGRRPRLSHLISIIWSNVGQIGVNQLTWGAENAKCYQSLKTFHKVSWSSNSIYLRMVAKIDSSCIPSSFSKIAITFYMLPRASILRMNQIEASYSLFLKQRVTAIETVWSEVFPPFHARLEWKRGKTIKDYYCFLPADSSRLVRLQRLCTKAIAGNGLILHITWARLSTYVKSCFHDLSRLAFWMCKSFHNSFASRPREREVLGRTNCLICAGETVYTQQHDMELWLSGWCEEAFIKFEANLPRSAQRVYTCTNCRL